MEHRVQCIGTGDPLESMLENVVVVLRVFIASQCFRNDIYFFHSSL